jgi:hypothetical protein
MIGGAARVRHLDVLVVYVGESVVAVLDPVPDGVVADRRALLVAPHVDSGVAGMVRMGLLVSAVA